MINNMHDSTVNNVIILFPLFIIDYEIIMTIKIMTVY